MVKIDRKARPAHGLSRKCNNHARRVANKAIRRRGREEANRQLVEVTGR